MRFREPSNMSRLLPSVLIGPVCGLVQCSGVDEASTVAISTLVAPMAVVQDLA